MSLNGLDFKHNYNNQEDDIIRDFMLPSLKEAVRYDRAVGFFSSSSLMSISIGIKKLVENGGHIRLVCSPRLSKEDIEAIKSGYDEREVIENALERDFTPPKDYFEEERLNILSHLIADGILDIKIAYVKSDSPNSLYHVKMGVIYDENANYVAFNGSMNDSENAFYENEETIDVFSSLNEGYSWAFDKKKYFDSLWNQQSPTYVMDFPDALQLRLSQYHKQLMDLTIDEKELKEKRKPQKKINSPCLPVYIKIRDYQENAYQHWKKNNYRGIYDMATGTGKTYTALYSIANLLHEKNDRLAIVICCPYQHLVVQWAEDLENFGFEYIMGFTGSSQKKWKEKLEELIFDYNHKYKKYLCFITTNASFATKSVQDKLSKIKENLLIVIDEAHNFGTNRLVSLLDDRFEYRLALSATLERHNDLAGTEKLYDFFGQKCIEYTLEMAIDAGMLCKYYYYPIIVNLDEKELEDYNKLSEELTKYIIKHPDGSVEYTKKAEMLLIKRSRIVAGAKMKLDKLAEIIKDFKHDNHLLIYCGATTVVDNDYKEGVPSDEEERQIDAVSKILNNEGIISSQFTSKEDSRQRELLKREFDSGKSMQALVAIRCLDEGVNIPSIDKAIILASSTNPKEYIQRRGRVLRTYSGKSFAIIYDFVTLPRNLNDITAMTDLTYDIGLIKRELTRVKDFASLSLNEYQSEKIIDEIEGVY